MKFNVLNRILFSLLLLGAFFSTFNYISPWLIIGFLIGYITFILIISTNIRLDFFIKAFNNKPLEKENRVALTFDDGPVENTLRVLEILDKYQVKASFFCIGKNIEQHPEIFRQIIEKGHFVGNHTWSHTRKMGFISTKRMVEEISKCDEICYTIGGIRPATFRPPFGIITPKIKRALEIKQHKVIGWNVRSYDAIINSENLVLKRIIRKIKPGDVILLHDTKELTVEILEQLLLFLRSNNYQPIRIDNLFHLDAYS